VEFVTLEIRHVYLEGHATEACKEQFVVGSMYFVAQNTHIFTEYAADLWESQN
jgi:hypothetical protein